jgi:predicted nucleic acid-binding protein
MAELGAVVTNTGPILALIACGHLRLLQRVFERVIVPAEVDLELRAGGRFAFGVDEYLASRSLERLATPRRIPRYLEAVLDPGEAAVIQAAKDLNIPRVLIDEWAGRRWARTEGLSVTGSLGVLVTARRAGEVVNIRDAAAQMTRHGIRIAQGLIDEAVRLGGE